MKFVVATKNQHKLKEFKRILNPFGIDVVSQDELNIDVDVEETALTFEGNSYIKAKAIYDIANMPTIADDSGLEVDALNGEPGVFSARYGGFLCKNDIERYNLLLENMKDVSDDKRQARFVCVITLIISNDKHYSFKGVCEGKIGYEPKGLNGFGYDPIFLVGEKSFSELSDSEKDKISHRGQALEMLKDKMDEIKSNIN